MHVSEREEGKREELLPLSGEVKKKLAADLWWSILYIRWDYISLKIETLSHLFLRRQLGREAASFAYAIFARGPNIGRRLILQGH